MNKYVYTNVTTSSTENGSYWRRVYRDVIDEWGFTQNL